MNGKVGDRLVVDGDETRAAVILAVPRADGSPPYVVRWLAAGNIAMVSPGEFSRVIPAGICGTSDRPGPTGAKPGPRSRADPAGHG